jgi:hypothetical protein
MGKRTETKCPMRGSLFASSSSDVEVSPNPNSSTLQASALLAANTASLSSFKNRGSAWARSQKRKERKVGARKEEEEEEGGVVKERRESEKTC